MEKIPSAVEVRQVHVVRGRSTILAGISCDIPAGRCTAILGPNGCGKTTFTRLLTGHAFITSGTVRVLGQTIGKTNIRTLRQRIRVVHPSADSASAHISGAVVDAELTAHEAALTGFFGTVGLYDQTTDDQHRRADDLLQQVGLADRRDLRFGLLSTGEQRRCLIARALVQPPQLLILDEPTAGLDITGREQVLATIEMVLSRPDPPTVLFITHHVEELLPRTEQVLLMRQGRFIMTGTPDQVITPETLSQTFGCKIYVSKSGGRFWPQVLPEAWLDLIDPAQRDDDKTSKD